MTKSILVIDDDQAIRDSFVLSLLEAPYQVDTAPSGEEGIEMVRKSDYDIIFLDLKMPGLDGVETMRELRKINKDTTIYILTAFYGDFVERLKEALKDGIEFEIMRKPITGDQIRLILESILGA